MTKSLQRLIPLALLCGIGCSTVEVLQMAVEAQRRSLVVGTLNVENKSESKSSTATRIRHISRIFKASAPEWGVIGFQELRYTKEGGTVTSYSLSSDTLTCADGSSGYAVDCFAVGMGSQPTQAIQDRGIGLLANPAYWEIIPGSKIHDFIGTSRADIIHRTVLGARFKNKTTGKIAPVYTVHISNTDNHVRQKEEISDAVRLIRTWQRSNDLPPVLVGDFNCESFSHEVRTELLNHFVRASDVNSIDLIFVGRVISFPHSGDKWIAQPNSARRLDVRQEDPPDHLATAVWLTVQSPATPDGPVPSSTGNHCP